MPVIPSSVLSVIKRFPEHTAVLQRLFKSDDEFLTLCDDYQMCKEALAYWSNSDSDQAPSRANEYQSLLKELENEILFNVHELVK